MVSSALLSIIKTNGGTLEIGGFTDIPDGANLPAARASSISIDGALNLAGVATTLRLDTTGAITEPGGPLTVTTLIGNAGSATFNNGGNLIGNLGSFTIGGEVVGNLSLVDAGALNITGAVSAATLALTAGGKLQIGTPGAAGSLTAGTVTLSANGPITEPNGAITATSFAASATGVVSDILLTNANNKIGSSTGITAASGNVAVVDDPALVLSGPFSGQNLFFKVAGAGGTLTLGTPTIGSEGIFGIPATLTSAGGGRISLVADNITVGNPASSVTANAGTVELAPFSPIDTTLLGTGGAPVVGLVVGAPLLSIVHTGSGTLEVGGFTDAATGATSPGASAVSVNVGPADLMDIASTLRLDALGAITQAGGPLIVGGLTGSAGTSANLTDPSNLIGRLSAFTTTAGFALVDNQALVVAGPVKDTGTTSALVVTTKSGDVTLAGNVSANVVDLISAGAISQTGGTLMAGILTGSAATSASLTQPTNLVGSLGAFSTTAGFALEDNRSLLVTGPVTDTGTVSMLALTTKTGDINLDGNLSAANLADLISAGAISQTGGTLIAGTLTGSAASASLTQPNNQIASLSAFSTAAGFALVDDQPLLVLGPVSDSGATSALALTTKLGDLIIAGPVNGTNLVSLTSASSISETGALTASTLSGSAAGAASLTGANQVAVSGGFQRKQFRAA